MSEATTTYEPKGLNRGGNDEGSNTDWAPLPPGRYRMHVESVTIKEPSGPPRKDANGKEEKQYPRVVYRLALDADDAATLLAKAAPSLKPGQEQSTSAWASFNYTWGWFDRENVAHFTKLFEFATGCGGFLVKSDAKKWFLNGGKVDPQWFVNMAFRGIVEHAPNKNGGVWVNVTPQALDDQEERNRDLFIKCARLDNAVLMNQLVQAGDEVGEEKPLF